MTTTHASFPIAVVSDCGGQAMSRMMTRLLALHSDAVCVPYESATIMEASGNVVDALDALAGRPGAIVCNSAPRKHARETNGDTIVYGCVRGHAIVVATVGTLGMLKKLVPDFSASAIDVDAFMNYLSLGERRRFNFRGLEVIPHILRSVRDRSNLSKVSSPHHTFPAVSQCAWLVDRIERKRTNIKLSILRCEAPWFVPGQKVMIQFSGLSVRTMTCYERLTDIPENNFGIYEGSSGYGDNRFLEVAVNGGSAAVQLNVGTPETMSHVGITAHPSADAEGASSCA